MRKPIAWRLATAMLAATLGCGPLAAPQAGGTPGIKRTILQSHAVPGTNYKFVEAVTEVGPNAVVPRHTHPGPEIMYVLQGSLTLEVEGAPTRQLTPGQTAYNPPGIPHGGRAGPDGVTFLVTWVVPQGRPLASPAKSDRRADGLPGTRRPLPALRASR
ncbi:MAG TPA: cupin domain-containing protein [Stellaceae bacterium]|nr:cupin domain-containing protein [Stellaceae bacterium]